MKIEIVDTRTVVLRDPPPGTLDTIREALSALLTPEIAARVLLPVTLSEAGTLGARKLSLPLAHADRSIAFATSKAIGERAVRRHGDVVQLEVNGGQILSTVSFIAFAEALAARRSTEADVADLHERLRSLEARLREAQAARSEWGKWAATLLRLENQGGETALMKAAKETFAALEHECASWEALAFELLRASGKEPPSDPRPRASELRNGVEFLFRALRKGSSPEDVGELDRIASELAAVISRRKAGR